MSVLGFNSGRNDLNLIKKHFAELLADTTGKAKVGKLANTTMFMKTNGFRLVDIVTCLGPGTTFEKWVKAVLFRNCGFLTNGSIA